VEEAMSELQVSLIVAVLSASLTAFGTHAFSIMRENKAKRQKMIGWLKWLSNLLNQIVEMQETDPSLIRKFDPNQDKLIWWASQTFLTIGDSLYLLKRSDYEDLIKLMGKCGINYPLHDGIYEKGKVQELQQQIDTLIRKIEDP